MGEFSLPPAFAPKACKDRIQWLGEYRLKERVRDLPHSFITRPAIELLGSLVPIGDPVFRIADDDSIEAEVQEARLSRQFGISSLSVCNVAGYGKLHETSIGHSQRRSMGLHVAARALKSHDVEFEGTSCTSTDFFIEGTKSVSVVWGNKV